MKIDYSKYTVAELLDVNENIDAGQFPHRHKLLQEEIERRKTSGELRPQVEEHDDSDDSDDNNEIIIEFSADGHSRKLFIFGFLIVNLVILAYMIPKYIVTDIVEVHE